VPEWQWLTEKIHSIPQKTKKPTTSAAAAATAAVLPAATTTANAIDAAAAVSVSLVAPPPLAPLTDSISSTATSTTHTQEDARATDSLAANTATAAAAAAAVVVPTAVAAAAAAAVDPALPVTTSPSLYPLTDFSSSMATPETHAHTDARAALPATVPPTAPPARPAPLLPLFHPTAEGKTQLVVLAHNHPAYHRLANTYTDRVLWIYANMYPDFYCPACYGPRFKGTHCHNCQCRCFYEVKGNHSSLIVSAKHPTHCICDASHFDYACPNCSARLVCYQDLHPQPPCDYCNCTNNNADSDDCNDCQHNLSGDVCDWMVANERFVKINLNKKTLASGYPDIQVDCSGLERPDAWPMVHRVLQHLAQAPKADSPSSGDSRPSTTPPPMPTLFEDTDEEKH